MDIKTLSTPLYDAKFWMKLVAVMSILYGILVALSIVGILIAWLPIWMGVLLFQCAGQVEQAYSADNAQALHNALMKIRTYFTIVGVLTLIGLVVAVLGFALGLTGMMAGMANM
jgi:hypothetical protein